MNIYKVVRSLGGIFRPIISYLWLLIKNARKLEFSDHLWPPFIDRQQSDVVVFEIITFKMYKILVTQWKHGISPNDIITFNEE